MKGWRKLSASERGIGFRRCDVLCEEEYSDLCRMTAERCEEGHIAIVCTVYGLTIQSVICTREQFPILYEEIKEGLSELLDLDMDRESRMTHLQDLFCRFSGNRTEGGLR